MKRTVLLATLLVLFVSCGKKEVPKQDLTKVIEAPASEQEKTAKEALNESERFFLGTKDEKCAWGGVNRDGMCRCGDGALTIEEATAWMCLGEFRRCLSGEGCTADGVTYPELSERRNGQVTCNGELPLDDLNGYVCEPIVWHHPKEKGAWKCVKQECDCEGEKIRKDAFCLPGGEFIAYLRTDGSVVGSLKRGGKYYCGGKELDESTRKLGPESLRCIDGEWSCMNGLVCKQGRWECGDSTEDDVCAGYPFEGLGATGERERYACRYGHWVCDDARGCTCDGKKIETGDECFVDQCMGTLEGKKKTSDFGALSQREEPRTDDKGLCIEGNCPCGDGFCPKFGKCVNGQCSCHNLKGNVYGEFYCRSYFRESLAELAGGEEGGMLHCVKNGGCKTPDGRHYAQGALIGFNGHKDTVDYKKHRKRHAEDVALAESRMFYIEGEYKLPESLSILGECVLGDTDSGKQQTEICLPRLRDGVQSILADGQCLHFYYGSENYKPHIMRGKAVLIESSRSKREDYYNNDESLTERDFEGLFAESNDVEEIGKAFKIFDVEKCEGGMRYCKGKNTDPMPLPSGKSYYECRNVRNIPGNHAKDGLKAWVCMDKTGCECGENLCGMYKACIDGRCVADAVSEKTMCAGQMLMPGYRCEEQFLPGFENDREIGQVCEDRQCECVGRSCPRNALCHGERCICGDSVSPGDDYACKINVMGEARHWRCNSDKGCDCFGKKIKKDHICRIEGCYGGTFKDGKCHCGETIIADTKSYDCAKIGERFEEVCVNPDGCPCGNAVCSASAVCRDNVCVDPLTNQPLKHASDKLEATLRCTADEGCECATSTCKKGEFCQGARCVKQSHALIIDNHRIFVDFSDFALPEEDEEGYTPKVDGWFADDPKEDAWKEIRILRPDAFRSDEYALKAYVYEHVMGQSETTILDFNPTIARCALPGGCRCGEEKCALDGICENDICVYDDFYRERWCGSDYGYVLHAGMKNNLCHCFGSVRTPTRDRYSCHPKGWICEEEKGCDCGNIKCSQGSVCVGSGACLQGERKPNQG